MKAVFASTLLAIVVVSIECREMNFLSSVVTNIARKSSFYVGDIAGEIGKTLTGDKLSENGKLNFTGIANKYGFESEEHQVITEDGYILTNFHIQGDVNKIVLLVHGGTLTSDCWIIRARQSLAIKLAEQKYDVWAINLRGTRYSRRHIYLDPDQDMEQFYNYTLLEQGALDLPATIDYILKRTGQRQMSVISHSLGTSSIFILGAEKPSYNDKIKVHIPLAPITYFKDLRGLLLLLYNSLKVLGALRIIPITRDGGIEVAGRITRQLLQVICINTIFSDACLFFVFALTGFDPTGLQISFFSTLFGHFTGGLSSKVLKLIIQNGISERFAKYDYGVRRNLEVYSKAEPPEFDLSKVIMKTAMVVGQEDIVVSVKDTQRVRATLPNVVRYLILPYPKFNHLDFVYARHMNITLFPYIFEILNKYGNYDTSLRFYDRYV